MDYNNKRILIVSPHGDDELLGMGGYMISEISKGSKVHVVFGTDGHPENDDSNTRAQEIEKVSKFVGFTYEILFHDMDCKLNTIDSKEIINAIDKVIEDFKPDEFYCCYPSHHQDHQTLYECSKACMRLKEGHIPYIYGLYEYIFIDPLNLPQGGLLYIDISEHIEKKLQAFELYKSQHKQSPSPLCCESVRTMNALRGIQCGKKYAELIYVQKIII